MNFRNVASCRLEPFIAGVLWYMAYLFTGPFVLMVFVNGEFVNMPMLHANNIRTLNKSSRLRSTNGILTRLVI